MEPFDVPAAFVAASMLSFLLFAALTGGTIVLILWAVQRLRRVGALERRLAELETRIWQIESDAQPEPRARG